MNNLVKDYRRILIIQWSAMGDCVLASSTFDDIKATFPHAKIDLNVLPPWHQLFVHDDRFHQLIDFKLRKQGFGATWRWLTTLKQENYDLIIDLQNSDRSRMLLSAAKTLRFTRATIIGRSRHWCYDNHIKTHDIENNHVVDRFYAALKSVGVVRTSTRPRIIASPEIIARIEEKKQHLLENHAFAVFVPGCSPQHPEKRWHPERFMELAQLLFNHNCVTRILILGAGSEAEICKQIADSDERIINLCDQTALLDIPYWLNGAELIVANDTGIAHFAAASDAPVIALFGPTNPTQSKPYGEKVTVLEAKNFGNDNKIDQITANDVLNHYQTIFNPSDKTV
ncbi:hypothetical protein B9T11_02990 [Wohlfahrtiimonas chitiniclastica]|uniref:glycosyltransferase family 9 protein n=1 Tax=Wohlfahrtiimonas chitiniclastica TaxID=400946 RepID=UPI000B98A899|nr:glycosyltransferase family 9 protein [Wohlfahrtiimonas chitiniclastica]OYQ70735.1 hypothetical protein B9T13_05570 [Wohlfahrtiimonas chitiniclastica]OYQ81983.1 hypothetical protein B9T11_02990 [Wohlfahrtiimonas chitiniclastica]OYQ83940.1 hypothetical protein B9T14_06865 [Wohlfahrtiimonas chitiniclastica]OYQ84779.1 hypothetical protein B9T15_06895 [Wohlfahrtiimonas chitiniclastica]